MGTSKRGSFLPEPDEAPPPLEMYIHPGRRLLEWSSLTVRGNERGDDLSKENAKQGLYSRGEPIGSSISEILKGLHQRYC